MNTSTVIATVATVTFASFASAAPVYTFSSGGVDGKYEEIGETITKRLNKKGIKAENLNSAGSVENIERMNDGEAYAAIVQMDALSSHPLTVKYVEKPMYDESVIWIFNKNTPKFQDLKDVEGRDDVVIAIVEGSGADVTLENFAKEDEGYFINYKTAVRVSEFYDAAELVANGKYEGKVVAGTLYVGGSVPSGEVQDFSDALLVGEATDKDFNDFTFKNGDHVYTSCAIDENQMGGLEKSTTFAPDTVCVKAALVYNTEHPMNNKAKRVINSAAKRFK